MDRGNTNLPESCDASVTQLVETVLQTASQTEQNAEAAATTALMVVASVQMVSGMMGEMSSRMSDVNTRLTDSRQCVRNAAAEARKTTASMARFNQAVEQIAATADAINEIAQMTSLLAINAAIEAARAGQSGGGFAVVAAEVRSLSQKTGRLTRDIGDQLEQIRRADSEVSETVKVVNDGFAQIEALFVDLTGIVEEQTASLGAVATFAKEATESGQSLEATLDRITALARETSAQCRLTGAATE